MKPKKIAILHFNIIEKYPPVMNFIFDAIEENPDTEILVFTTKNTTTFKTPTFPNTKIYRLGMVNTNPIIRYASYVWFNLACSMILLFKSVEFITAFESLSIFPLWVRSKIKHQTKAHIHFHEYHSEPERQISSAYMKFLFTLEDQLLKKYSCSHTNEDRKRLFLVDKTWLKKESVKVIPNMPPKSWWKNFGQFKKPSIDVRIRLVYVGACDDKTMYIKEVIDWVFANQDSLELNIISQQLSNQTNELILGLNCPSIKIIQPIDYYDLPQELIKYDVGLVLYKGHIPNYIYNVPNKVFEYLACGLNVICDKSLITTKNLGLNNIKVVDFKNLNGIDFLS